jgi:hypothetical protein
MPILTTILEVLAVALIIAFCVVVWWPSALLVGGIALLVMSWAISGSSVKPKPEPPT